jgi:hypothetical protein
MDLEPLVRRAAQGDVKAFVRLTERFQHFAFGSALALVGDFHQAEDAPEGHDGIADELVDRSALLSHGA